MKATENLEEKINELSRIELLLISKTKQLDTLRQEKAQLLGYKAEDAPANRHVDKIKLAELNLDIEKLNKDISDLHKEKNSLLGKPINEKTGLFVFSFIFGIFLAFSFSLIISLLFNRGDNYIDKNLIQEKILTIINNNAPLDIVREIYNTRDNYKISTKDRIFNFSKTSYYKYDVSLSQILVDIKIKCYENNTSNDLIAIDKVDKIYKEYVMINPFDTLEESQKDLFKNIAFKLSIENYTSIQMDLEKISKELREKNMLVNKYLSDSTSSYILSIIALILSFVISIYQIYTSIIQSKKNETFQLSVLSYLEKNK